MFLLPSFMSTTVSKNMVTSPSPSLSSPRLQCTMEWNVIQNKIKSSLLLLLLISAIFLLSILYSSNSFTTTTKESLSQSSLLTDLDISLMPTTQSPSQNSTPAIEEQCDISIGKWVKEPRGPIYTNMTCSTLPDFKNCQKYGKEQSYLYWRWKPDGCDLPRFDPERFLGVVRGKKLAFIGDSLARNQMESLLCLLSQAETPIDIYKDSADRYRTWYFPSHNFTLMVMWTEFYVQGVQRIINGTASASFDIHLDKINNNWASQLPSINYAIISGGNWFFRTNYLYEGGEIIGCVNCREENLTDFGIPYAVKRVINKALESINECKECDGLVTFLRTYTPSHFENGSWFNGGYCNKTQPLDENELNLYSIDWELRKIQLEEIKRVKEENGSKKFELLDVTKAMMLRVDGHPGANYDKRWVRNANDCLHWCLPGPVDMWNDLLLQLLTRNQSSQ
ncbi:xyloglucan O-acetyltransferase 3-like isoform X2 [Typha latifolia]|uniref:xyloglucan O-acetyltransferase 3-like isoform X2 n=1 Tax=Typha latifolia TaxID=4733 RepID=UPI003C2C3C5D